MRSLFGHFKDIGDGNPRTMFVVGCTKYELVAHLHNNPHGHTLDTPGIHIDHIRPVCSFKNKASDPLEQHRCMNFNNLQLLTGPENLAKRGFYDAVAYAQSDAGKAIEKLVPTWNEMYYGIKV